MNRAVCPTRRYTGRHGQRGAVAWSAARAAGERPFVRPEKLLFGVGLGWKADICDKLHARVARESPELGRA
jgi:hypothetical protein